MVTTVEILLATYNGENFLEEQVESILNQEGVKVKLTISDGGSSDSTLQKIESYKKKYPETITCHTSSKRLSVIENFSRLLSLSKEKYILFSDQDDVWSRDKASRSLAVCKELEQGGKIPVLVHHDLQVVDASLNLIADSFWKYAGLKPTCVQLNRLIVQNIITGCTVLMNRELVDLLDPIPGQAIMHDWWAGLVASLFGKIGYITTPMIQYRQHGGNVLGAKRKNLFAFSVEKRKKAAELSKKRREQVKALLDVYEGKISPSHRDILDTYLHLHDVSYFQRKWRVFSYRFFPCSYVRSLLVLFSVSFP